MSDKGRNFCTLKMLDRFIDKNMGTGSFDLNKPVSVNFDGKLFVVTSCEVIEEKLVLNVKEDIEIGK